MITAERQAACIRNSYLITVVRQEIAFFDKETSTGDIIAKMLSNNFLIQDAMGEKVLAVAYAKLIMLILFMISIGLTSRFVFCSGRKFHTVHSDIPRWLLHSFCKGMAIHSRHAIHYPASCHLWCHHGEAHGQTSVPCTRCLFSCSDNCRSDNQFNQNCKQL